MIVCPVITEMRFFCKRNKKTRESNLSQTQPQQDHDLQVRKCNDAKWVLERRSSREDVVQCPQQCETYQSEQSRACDEGEIADDDVDPLLHRKHIIDAQRVREENARMCNTFVQHQRVSYFFKGAETWHDATICDVHYDDGPDRPYYTIQYWGNEVEYDDEEGHESVVCRLVEKQTTTDRLHRVDFDPDKTWMILKKSRLCF